MAKKGSPSGKIINARPSAFVLTVASYKQRLVSFIRSTGLLPTAERLRMQWAMLRTDRSTFLRNHEGVSLPPDESAYDAYGTLNWDNYWLSGRQAATFIADLIRTHGSTGRILEWGCGPGRIIRHLPVLLPGSGIHGSDYNAQSIAWCTANLEGIAFVANDDLPPLPFPSAHFDCIYSISVFTHLSAAQHRLWIAELERLLRPGGTFVCTLHGETCKQFLLPDEVTLFERGELVIRSGVKRGSRCFVAYHPESFVRDSLLSRLKVVDHRPGNCHAFGYQDLWIAQKP